MAEEKKHEPGHEFLARLGKTRLRPGGREAKIFKKHAARSGMTLSDFAAAAMRERMEDELDRQAYEEAMAEFRKNPVTYSHAEVAKMLGIEDEDL